MIVDSVLFNGEHDLLKLRLAVLGAVVDEFHVCEAPVTFSGKEKDLTFNPALYPSKKLHYHILSHDEDLWQDAKRSTTTGGLGHWCREYVQRESMKKYLTHLADTDTVYFGDVDELWNPTLSPPDGVSKLKLLVYSYFLNNRSSEEFWGTVVAPWGILKDLSLNEVRSFRHHKTTDYYGWHFTSMGGVVALTQKIESYGHQEFNTPAIKNALSHNFGKRDYIGRDFTFWEDESEWPDYLKQTRDQWRHLLS